MFPVLAGWMVALIQSGLIGYGIVQSVLEHRIRAAGLLSLGLVPPVLIGILILHSTSPLLEILLMAYAGLSILLSFSILVPFPSRKSLDATSGIQRVDERDAVFHRFYRLQKDTPEWNAFYDTHPELKEWDARIREMPQLQEPGSKSFDPVTSSYSHAAFDMVEPLAKNPDEPDVTRTDPVPMTPEEATNRLCGFARHLGAAEAGTTKLNPAWIYSHVGRGPGTWGDPIALDHQWAVAIAKRWRMR